MSRPDLLEDELRAIAPQPDESFTRRLDAEAAAGFPKRRTPSRTAKKRSWLPSLRGPQIVAGLCSLLLLAGVGGVIVSTAGDSGSDGSSGASTSASDVEIMEQSSPAPSSGTASSAAEPPAVGSAPAPADAAAGARERRVERSADLEVAVTSAEFDDANAQVMTIAGRAGAIVDTSEISREGAEGDADYTLRVPVERLSATLADLSALGRLESRDEAGFDVTGQFVSARDRAGDLRAERASLRRQLAAEADPAAAEELRTRLQAVQRELSAARSALAQVRQRTSFATVELTLRTDEAAGEDEGSAGFTPGDALDDAGGVLGALAGVAILVLAIVGPIALVLLALVAAARLLRRRRRERVLAA